MKFNQVYRLRNAVVHNLTGKKNDLFARRITVAELRRHRDDFEFDFVALSRHFIIYKLYVAQDCEAIQGLVAFRATPNTLECANMETNRYNRRGCPKYGGIGKAIVALCCKYSFDNGMNGSIYFDAKSGLISYYKRMGVKHIFGLRMFLNDQEAQKLIDKYFY